METESKLIFKTGEMIVCLYPDGNDPVCTLMEILML